MDKIYNFQNTWVRQGICYQYFEKNFAVLCVFWPYRKNETGNRNIYIGENAGRHHSSGNGKVIIGGGDLGTTGNTGSRILEIHGYDGSTRTTWITGDSSGNITVAGTVTANGTVLTAGASPGFAVAMAIAL